MSEELTHKLNYVFKNPAFLTTALTHRSRGGDHNERLEFLGDAVVNFVIAEILYFRFPEATEGELSRFRATLVNRDALADIARRFDLGNYIFLGPGEIKSGGSERQSILSCAMEAVIGAVYLDGGYEVTHSCINNWYVEKFKMLSDAASHKDPKTLLQELLQSMRLPLPVYTVEEVEGRAHQQQFIMRCRIHGVEHSTIGRGTSRRRAEQDAASAMLEVLNK